MYVLDIIIYGAATIGLLLGAFNIISLILALRGVNRYFALTEYIATEYSIKWFTLEMLIEKKFKRQDCEYVVINLLYAKVLDSRISDSKEPNDFQEVLLAVAGNQVFLDSSKLKPFLDLSEFRYVGPPPPRRKRKSQKLNWDTLLPQGLKPAYS